MLKLLLVTGLFLPPSWAFAQPLFYQDKTITLVAGTTPGSQYDAHARIIARHWAKQVPTLGELMDGFKTEQVSRCLASVALAFGELGRPYPLPPGIAPRSGSSFCANLL